MSGNKTIIYTQEDCPLCDKVKEKIGEGNYLELKAKDLITGEIKDLDAMTQLCEQNMELPLIWIDSEFIKPEEFLKE